MPKTKAIELRKSARIGISLTTAQQLWWHECAARDGMEGELGPWIRRKIDEMTGFRQPRVSPVPAVETYDWETIEGQDDEEPSPF